MGGKITPNREVHPKTPIFEKGFHSRNFPTFSSIIDIQEKQKINLRPKKYVTKFPYKKTNSPREKKNQPFQEVKKQWQKKNLNRFTAVPSAYSSLIHETPLNNDSFVFSLLQKCEEIRVKKKAQHFCRQSAFAFLHTADQWNECRKKGWPREKKLITVEFS